MNYDDWMKELDSEKGAHQEPFRDRAQKVVDRYEDEHDREDTKFNILWSNTEVLHSALYARSPNPDIRRRYLDKDPDGKKAATIAERIASYCIDAYDLDATIDTALDDYLLAGMGQIRLRYKPYFEMGEAPRINLTAGEAGFDADFNMTYAAYNGDERIDEHEMDEEGPYMLGDAEQEVVSEDLEYEPVNWRRFRWQPCARWEDCDWACIEHYMTFEELEKAYGKETAKKIPLGYTDEGIKAQDDDEKERARIYEIFDRKERKNIEIAEGLHEFLKEEEDPLQLEGYYPFPRPLVSTLKNGKFIPMPDYVFYQDQAEELDRVTNRIDKLTESLKVRGVYDASFTALANLENADDGEYFPLDDFSVRFNGTQGDLNKVIATMPIEEIQKVLVGLHQSREQIKQVIYEITGIADIMRGTSNANETLGAQQLKTQFGSMRMGKRQRLVAKFVRDVIRIQTEIVIENFQPETIQEISGMELTQEVYDILTDDLMRSYRIDIETDSTVTEDAQAEKQGRVEMIQAVTLFMKEAGPMVQAGLFPPNVAKELLGFLVRGFKIGRTLEEVLDEMAGDEEDPRMQEMQQQVDQHKQELQQQAQQHVEGVQQEAQGKVEQSEKKAFEAQKQLAINKAVNQAKIWETNASAKVDKDVKTHATELNVALAMFKEQLAAQQGAPLERMDELGAAMNKMAEIIFQQEERYNTANDELKSKFEGMEEFMKRPATAEKQPDGSWKATRH
jgi:hypothetical protein